MPGRWALNNPIKTLLMKKKLIDALIKCAKAHKVEWTLYDDDPDDVQFAVMSTKIPLVADMQTIAEAFFGHSSGIVHVDNSWGYADFLLDHFPMLDEPDIELLKTALPYETKL